MVKIIMMKLLILIFYTFILRANTIQQVLQQQQGSTVDSNIFPIFPLQFTATLKITSNLIDENNDYPPRYRQITIYYDYINKKARADIEAGYEAAKIYIRRYDKKNEYMIRLPPINDCKRAYLGEVMPFPDIPDSKFIGIEVINDIECNYFIFNEYETRIHIYMNKYDNSPVRLIQEDIVDQLSIPVLTYDYSDIELGPPDESWFDLTSLSSSSISSSSYEHKSCVKHSGGFPYLHIFHYFIRF